MRVVEIRKLDTKTLSKEVVKLREDIAESRRRIYMGETQNIRSLRIKRKDLARMMTVMGEQLQASFKQEVTSNEPTKGDK